MMKLEKTLQLMLTWSIIGLTRKSDQTPNEIKINFSYVNSETKEH